MSKEAIGPQECSQPSYISYKIVFQGQKLKFPVTRFFFCIFQNFFCIFCEKSDIQRKHFLEVLEVSLMFLEMGEPGGRDKLLDTGYNIVIRKTLLFFKFWSNW